MIAFRLGWGLAKICDPARHEYAIVAVESFDEIACIADSFQQLIEDVCDVMLAPDPTWSEKEFGPQRCSHQQLHPLLVAPLPSILSFLCWGVHGYEVVGTTVEDADCSH